MRLEINFKFENLEEGEKIERIIKKIREMCQEEELMEGMTERFSMKVERT